MRILHELTKALKRFDYLTNNDLYAIINMLGRFKLAKENNPSISFGEFVLGRYTYLEDFEINDKEVK